MIRILWLLAALTLTGCSQLPPATKLDSGALAERVAALALMQKWSLQGRLGIVTPDEAISANIRWTQFGDGYQITVTGPFGAGAVSLTGNTESVVAKTADGNSFQADNAGELLQRSMGVAFPVEALRYWVLGLPDPALAYRAVVDTEQRPIELEQAGWHVVYSTYKEAHSKALPYKIVATSIATNPGMKVKLIISDWRVNGGS